MESKKAIETVTSKVTIIRGDADAGDESVKMTFEDLGGTEVNLNDSSVNDIKALFDKTFEYINENKKLIKFELDDSTEDLFKQVAGDVLEQLNQEIIETEQNFVRIWELSSKED